MTGIVTADREAVLELTVRGPSSQETEITAVLDTGYTGSRITLDALDSGQFTITPIS
jgi:hypothetical protein